MCLQPTLTAKKPIIKSKWRMIGSITVITTCLLLLKSDTRIHKSQKG